MADTLVKVEGVSKKFCKETKRYMRYAITDIGRNMLGLSANTENLRKGEFWSVDNISFELKRGESLGLIGPNGAGKSTLLKILNGIISPDKGRVEIKGKVGALLELGAGFHPMLTGRENIYINGSILGFTKKELDRRFDEIVEFSELGEFIDTPVKHYSSGMYVRLGFAIAAQMEPDVLLIDEVLAVGDIGFKAKCFNTISRILKNAAVIFVSHAMPQVARICTDICVMNNGKIQYIGNDLSEGIKKYYSFFKIPKGTIEGSGQASLHSIELESMGKKNVYEINYLDDLSVHLYITVNPEVKYVTITISLSNQDLQTVAQSTSLYDKGIIENNGEPLHITARFPAINFNPGIYLISVNILDETKITVLTQHRNIKEFMIIGKFAGSAPVQLCGEWEIEKELTSGSFDIIR